MHVYQFPCPHCGARLRLRDKSLAGRRVECPDCRRPLDVVAAADGSLTGSVPVVSSHPAATSSKVPPGPAGDAEPGPAALPLATHRSWTERLRSPAGVAWVLAGSIAVVVLGVLFGMPAGDDRTDDSATAAATPPAGSPHADVPPASDEPTAATTESRFQRLSAWLADYSQKHGTFPAGAADDKNLPPDQQLSWLAALAAEQPDAAGLRPQWDRPWHDPLNDRFVRRRIEAFKNPAVADVVGQDGYPAGHFVGMAGVGAGAAELPAHDGRAGVFGYDRATRPEDIRDGASNTILVAGVHPTTADQPPLASWAAGGRATVRPFVQEPYINGPDGIGTGQPEGMLVLMADGSVKFLSRETDPSILRRMAAMADGLPLDSAVPGEPSAHGLNPPPLAGVPPIPPVPAEDIAGQPGDDRPIDVPLAPDPPRIDIAAALGQRIASIEQSQPVPASALLQQVAEMAGVTIDARAVIDDKSLAGRLNTPITLNLTQTTVGGILEAVLQQVGLKYEAGEFGIRVLGTEVETR